MLGTALECFLRPSKARSHWVHVMVIAMTSQAFGLLLPPVALVRGRGGVLFPSPKDWRWSQSSFDLVQGGTWFKIKILLVSVGYSGEWLFTSESQLMIIYLVRGFRTHNYLPGEAMLIFSLMQPSFSILSTPAGVHSNALFYASELVYHENPSLKTCFFFPRRACQGSLSQAGQNASRPHATHRSGARWTRCPGALNLLTEIVGMFDTLWWTNIAMENGHRNSGFSH